MAHAQTADYLDRYLKDLRRRGFAPSREAVKATDPAGVVHESDVVVFRPIGGLPGPIPRGVNFVPSSSSLRRHRVKRAASKHRGARHRLV